MGNPVYALSCTIQSGMTSKELIATNVACTKVAVGRKINLPLHLKIDLKLVISHMIKNKIYIKTRYI